jgi:hypothetical protein
MSAHNRVLIRRLNRILLRDYEFTFTQLEYKQRICMDLRDCNRKVWLASSDQKLVNVLNNFLIILWNNEYKS